MPCRCEGADEQDRIDLVNRVHQLTRMLCTLLETGKPDPEIEAWWAEHKREDLARQAREVAYDQSIRTRALKQMADGVPFDELLTSERRALGGS